MFNQHFVMSDPGDNILCKNLESLMREQNLPAGMNTQEYLYVQEVTRTNFYKDAIPRVPRVVQYIFEANLDTDEKAAGLDYGLRRLMVFDGDFVNALMSFLSQPNIQPSGIAAVGAYMVRIISDYSEAHPAEESKAKKAGKKDAEAQPVTTTPEIDAEAEGIARLTEKVGRLLKDVSERVDIKCPGLSTHESLAVAAALAMQNELTIPQLLDSNLPITANLIDIIREGGNNQAMNVVIASAFLLSKEDYPKLTDNQNKFIDSLTTYVYKLVNEKSEMEIYAFLTWVYGTVDTKHVNLENYIIDPRACGTERGRFHATAKHMFSAKKK